MMGWTLDERRDRVVTAAIALAAEHGIEHVNLRAAAAAAELSWESARTCFDDQADLLAAMSRRLTALTVDGPLALAVPTGRGVASALEELSLLVWEQVSADREHQLLGYELALLGLRRTALRPLAVQQHTDAWSAAVAVLAAVADEHGVAWSHPVEDVARTVCAFFDGVSLAWVTDGDADAARRQVVLFARAVASLAVPGDPAAAVVPTTMGADAGAHASDGSSGELAPR